MDVLPQLLEFLGASNVKEKGGELILLVVINHARGVTQMFASVWVQDGILRKESLVASVILGKLLLQDIHQLVQLE